MEILFHDRSTSFIPVFSQDELSSLFLTIVPLPPSFCSFLSFTFIRLEIQYTSSYRNKGALYPFSQSIPRFFLKKKKKKKPPVKMDSGAL
jgi:hypothetical protein